MRQFVYISTAAADVGREDVERILAASQRNNPARGITGFLIYNGRNFLQLVEGEQGALQALMLSLARDPRHHGIVKIEDVPIEQRLFGDWDMKQLELSKSVADRRAGIEKWLPEALDPQVRRTVLNFAALK